MVSLVALLAQGMESHLLNSPGVGGGGGRGSSSMIVMGRCEALCRFPSGPLNFLGSGFNNV